MKIVSNRKNWELGAKQWMLCPTLFTKSAQMWNGIQLVQKFGVPIQKKSPVEK